MLQAARYFTTWCLILYGARALGLVPYNVLLLSIAVLAGAALINLTINEHYHAGIDFVTHYVPFLLALKYESWDPVDLTEGISFFVAYLFTYLVYNKFDFVLLHKVYQSPNCFLRQDGCEII
jgi:hypothetical protein